MANSKNNNEYENTRKLNPGIFIFLGIFIYILICIIISFKSDTIAGYQVKKGKLSENRIYTGIALRAENSVYSEKSGYINYFVREGERCAVNNLVYCIDESGKLSDLYGKDPTDDNSLDKGELTSLRQEFMLFSKNFDETYFPECRTFENRVSNELTQIENRRILDNVSIINSSHSNDYIDYFYAKGAGIVLYYKDGYEEKTAGELSEYDFDEKNYKAYELVNDELVEVDGFSYKYVSDENWSIVIMVPREEAARITELGYVNVKFSKTLNTSWAKVERVKETEDNVFFELSFTNSMITFCKDRFVEVELILDEDMGLKIPNSSIAEKSFFLIDKDFVTKGNNSSDFTVLREVYTDEGLSVKSVTIDIVKEDENEYYVDPFSLQIGDRLIKPDSLNTPDDKNTFIVGKQGTLIGVYNINKGYADFNRIEILCSNDEYSIINPNSAYGLRAYDYIALDASIVTDKDFVY